MAAAALWLLASYLLGSIPTSHLLSRFIAGIDLRQHGSGNLGATNLYRVLGWKYAVPAGLVDIAKGAIPVLVFGPQLSDSKLFALACGVAAILGHVFSVFVGFKGGKGVATALGVILCTVRSSDHRTECAAILLEFGADPSPKDTHGETPVMWATKHALTDISGFLKARGAT